MSQYDPKFEVCYLQYFLMYYTHMTLPNAGVTLTPAEFLFYFIGKVQFKQAVVSCDSCCSNCTSYHTHMFHSLKISPPKKWKFSDKKSVIFHILAQNIDCVYSLELPDWGSSNEYPQSMFSSRNKKKNVYPCKSQFY